MNNSLLYQSIKIDRQTYHRIKRRAKTEGRTITGLIRLVFASPSPLKTRVEADR